MQQVQYPNLLQNNINNEQNSYSYSSPQPALIENNYITTDNQNQQQQQDLAQVIFYAFQVTPEEEFQQNNSPYIKDLPFQQQKKYLMEILGLFLIWTSIYIFFIYLLQDILRNSINRSQFFILMFVGFSFMILFSIMGLKKKNRKNSVIYFFATILSYILALFPCYLIMNSSRDLDFGFKFSLMIIYSQISNFVITIIMILCISCFEREFNQQILISVVFIILTPVVFFLQKLLFTFNFGFLYTILLANSLKQILKGKFKLKRNEVMVGAIAANIGIFFCCESNEI